MNWQRLAEARTMLLVLVGFLAIAGGVAMFNLAAGVIVFGVSALALAYLTDPSGSAPGRPARP